MNGIPSGGAWLRLLLGLSVAGLAVTVWAPTPQTVEFWLQLLLDVVLGCWAVARPGGSSALVVLIAAIGARAWGGTAVLDARLIALLLLVPLVHQLAALAAVIPPRAVLRPAALLPTAMRLIGALLVTVLILLLVPVR